MHLAGCKFRALYDACSVTNIPRGVLSTRVNPDTSRLRVDVEILDRKEKVADSKISGYVGTLPIHRIADTRGAYHLQKPHKGKSSA